MNVAQSPNGILVFQKRTAPGEPKFQIFRKNEDTIEYFDRKKGEWAHCNEEIYKGLKFDKEDWLVFLGQPFDVNQGAGCHHARETPDNPAADGYFYHEAQGAQSGSYCAVHAANAFFGCHALDIGQFYPAVRKKMIEEGIEVENESERVVLDPSAIYQADADVADVRKGADPRILLDYIDQLVSENRLPTKYSFLSYIAYNSEALDKIPKDCDRIIVGYGGSHFAAIRKNKNTNNWHLIDSMENDSQNKDKLYTNLIDAIETSPRGSGAASMTLIF